MVNVAYDAKSEECDSGSVLKIAERPQICKASGHLMVGLRSIHHRSCLT